MAFGDSFTWGSDMTDTMRDFEWNAMPAEWKRANRFDDMYSKYTWQSFLANKLGLSYVCLAEQGCSNQSIVRRFFENVQRIQPGDLVSVNFTWRDRYDFFNDTEQKWHTVRPSGTEDTEYHELYYTHLHSSTWDQIESLKAINLIIDYLKLNNIDFVAIAVISIVYTRPQGNNPFNEPKVKKLHLDLEFN